MCMQGTSQAKIHTGYIAGHILTGTISVEVQLEDGFMVRKMTF